METVLDFYAPAAINDTVSSRFIRVTICISLS